MKKVINLLLIQIVVNFLLAVIFELFQVNNIELKWYIFGVINGAFISCSLYYIQKNEEEGNRG